MCGRVGAFSRMQIKLYEIKRGDNRFAGLGKPDLVLAKYQTGRLPAVFKKECSLHLQAFASTPPPWEICFCAKHLPALR